MTTPTGAEVWRDYEISNIPASGPRRPAKADIRAWAENVETLLGASAIGLVFLTRATLFADLAYAAHTSAIVIADSTAAYNGLYLKLGVSGAGSWVRVSDLQNAVLRLTVTGGSGNAIVATSPETPSAPGNKLYLMTPGANNTGAATVSVNGGIAAAIKNALGSQLAADSLIAGSSVLMQWSVDHYQLLVSVPVDATGILSDAIDARNAAEDFSAAAAASAAALGNQVHQYDTRAQAAAATIPAGVQAIRITRDGAGSPLAFDTYVPGTATGPRAFQEATGDWWELDLSGARLQISAPVTIYASTTGSESNSGFTPGSPWPVQYACDFVSDRIVINNVRVKVQLAGGTYPPIVLRSYVGSVDVNPGTVIDGVPGDEFTVPWLCGDPSNLEAVKIDGGGNFAVVGVACHTPWFITDMRVNGNLVSGVTGLGLLADFGTVFYGGNLRFGPGAAGAFAQWNSRIEWIRGTKQEFYGSLGIGVRVTRGSQILSQGSVVNFLTGAGVIATVPGTGPNYTGAFAYADDVGSRIDMTLVTAWNGTIGVAGCPAAEFNGGVVVSPELLPFGNVAIIYYQANGFASEGSSTAAAGVVAASAWTKVTWGSNTRDDGGWNRTAGVSFPLNSYSPTKAGWYIVTLQLELNAIVNGKVFIAAIYRNGALLRQSPIIASGNTEETGAIVSAMIHLDGSTHYLEAYAFHNDTVPQTLNPSTIKTQFFAYRL